MLSREQRQWLQAGCEFLADDIARCCQYERPDDPCETCRCRAYALLYLVKSKDCDGAFLWRKHQGTPPFAESVPAGDVSL